MGIADELEKLRQLHASGGLTDEEYRVAKKKVLAEADDADHAKDGWPPKRDTKDEDDLVRPIFGRSWRRDSLGDAANRYVSFQIVMAIVGFVFFLIFFLGFWLPGWNDAQQSPFP